MPRKQKKYHYIYKTTNLINSKFYVGMHSTDDLNDGYLGSGKHLRRSITKYSKENFKIEILEFFESRDELKEREEELVNESLLKDPMCMNLKKGGIGGGTFSKESSLKGRLTVNKILLDRMKTDIVYLENFKKSVSTALQNYYKNGGKQSEKSKNKIRDKAKLRIGLKNNQFGFRWIYKNNTVKKIKKEELESFLKNGWKKGRKIK